MTSKLAKAFGEVAKMGPQDNAPDANLLPLEQLPAGWLLESLGEDDHAHRWFCRISDKKFITIGYGKHARAAMLDAISKTGVPTVGSEHM